MKQTINYSRFNFAFILLAFVVLFISCSNEDEPSSDINRVSMKTLPQVDYILGNALNLSDMVITLDKGGNKIDIPFASFGSEGITTEPENGKILELSDNSVTIKLGTSEKGKGLIQAINVTNDVTAIEIKEEPVKNYINGQKLNLADMVVTLTYENGDQKDFDYTEIKEGIETVPANGDVLSVDNDKVSITYVSSKVKVVQELKVIRFAPVKGVLVTGPLKSQYDVGEQLDLAGTLIRYTLLDNSEIEVAYEAFEAFKLTANPAHGEKVKANVSEIKVSHVNGVVVKIPITVNPLNVVGMELVSNPEKITYQAGETIDLEGLSVKLSVSGSDDLTVLHDDFDSYGIIATPADGSVFVDGTTEIVISYPGLSNTIAISLGSEILYESDFSNGLDGWITNQNGGGSASVYEENRTVVIKDIVPGVNTWDVQFYKTNFNLVKDGKYKLTVVVKAYPGQGNFELSLSVGDGDGRDGYQPYDGGGKIALVDSEYSTYENIFTMSKADTPIARILLDIGNQSNGIIIKSVKLERI